MFPHGKELLADVYEMLQCVFVNKFQIRFVQQRRLPEVTDSTGSLFKACQSHGDTTGKCTGKCLAL